MRVLVTGGAGFVGSHVVDRLVETGHQPVIFDLRRSPYHNGDIASVRGDLDDLDALCRAMEGCHAAIHLAAAADVDAVEKAPLDAERSNARGTAHVLEAARRTGVARVIYASTIWVYSDTVASVHEEDTPLMAPAHLYTATKLAGEQYCRSYRALYGLESTVLRFGIPYGPRSRPTAVVPAFVRRALAGEPLTLAGDGLQSRRFVYVEDLADGVVRALAPEAADRVYNLVGDTDVTIREIADTVGELIGGVEVVHGPGRSGDFAGAPVSGERAAADLGWRPVTPFREGVRRCVEWQRETAAAEASARVRRTPLAPVLRRAALGAALAAGSAALGVGLAALAPMAPDSEQYDIFITLLLLQLPFLLALGVEWGTASARRLRMTLWGIVAVVLATLVLPWPHALDHFSRGHAVVLALVALSAAGASLLARGGPTRTPLRD